MNYRKYALCAVLLSGCSASALPLLPSLPSDSAQALSNPITSPNVSFLTLGSVQFRTPLPADLRAMGVRPGNGYNLPIQPSFNGANSIANQLTSGNYTFEASFVAPTWGDLVVAAFQDALLAPPVSGSEAAYIQQTILLGLTRFSGQLS